jgi:hypothetical protein
MRKFRTSRMGGSELVLRRRPVTWPGEISRGRLSVESFIIKSLLMPLLNLIMLPPMTQT